MNTNIIVTLWKDLFYPIPLPLTSALRYRNFALLWSGLIASNIGTRMQYVAVGWFMLQLTNSALWLGLQGLCFAVPMIFLPLIVVAMADYVNRIKLLYITP